MCSHRGLWWTATHTTAWCRAWCGRYSQTEGQAGPQALDTRGAASRALPVMAARMAGCRLCVPDGAPLRERAERGRAEPPDFFTIVMQCMCVRVRAVISADEWADLRSQVDDSFWVMRMIGYPPLPNDYDGFSCGAHKDYGCLTYVCVFSLWLSSLMCI